MELDAGSLERLIPDEVGPGDVTGSQALAISRARYEFAARSLRPGRLLDIACGVGYGTRLLSDAGGDCVQALGVDLSADAVAYAIRRYGNLRTRFACADALAFDDPDGFDTIVSIETVEHLRDPVAFAARLVRLLRPSGILVASVPTTPSVDANPHHLHDFSERSFRALFEAHGLTELDALVQKQPFSPVAVLRRSEPRLSELRRDLPRYYLAHPGALWRRIAATLRFGFANRYLTVAWRAPE